MTLQESSKTDKDQEVIMNFLCATHIIKNEIILIIAGHPLYLWTASHNSLCLEGSCAMVCIVFKLYSSLVPMLTMLVISIDGLLVSPSETSYENRDTLGAHFWSVSSYGPLELVQVRLNTSTRPTV